MGGITLSTVEALLQRAVLPKIPLEQAMGCQHKDCPTHRFVRQRLDMKLEIERCIRQVLVKSALTFLMPTHALAIRTNDQDLDASAALHACSCSAFRKRHTSR